MLTVAKLGLSDYNFVYAKNSCQICWLSECAVHHTSYVVGRAVYGFHACHIVDVHCMVEVLFPCVCVMDETSLLHYVQMLSIYEELASTQEHRKLNNCFTLTGG